MTPAHIFLAVGVAMLWGFGFVTSKYGADHMPPLFFLTLRFVIVALILVWFVRFPRERIVAVIVFSLSMGAGHFGLFYIALNMGVEASTAAIVWQTQVPITMLLATLVLRERPGRLGVLGMAVAFGGVIVLGGEPRHASNVIALIIMLASSVMWAVANIQAKKLTGVEPLALNAWMSVFAAILLFPLSMILESDQIARFAVPDWRLHGSLAFQVVGSTVLAYWGWYFLLARYPVSRVAGFMLLVPLFGFIAGIFALGEVVTWQTAAGGAATLIGVSLIVLRARPAQPRTPQAGANRS